MGLGLAAARKIHHRAHHLHRQTDENDAAEADEAFVFELARLAKKGSTPECKSGFSLVKYAPGVQGLAGKPADLRKGASGEYVFLCASVDKVMRDTSAKARKDTRDDITLTFGSSESKAKAQCMADQSKGFSLIGSNLRTNGKAHMFVCGRNNARKHLAVSTDGDCPPSHPTRLDENLGDVDNPVYLCVVGGAAANASPSPSSPKPNAQIEPEAEDRKSSSQQSEDDTNSDDAVKPSTASKPKPEVADDNGTEDDTKGCPQRTCRSMTVGVASLQRA